MWIITIGYLSYLCVSVAIIGIAESMLWQLFTAALVTPVAFAVPVALAVSATPAASEVRVDLVV